MRSIVPRAFGIILVANFVALTLIGCQSARKAKNECPSPVSQGINVRDMVDVVAQKEVDDEINLPWLENVAEKFRGEAVEAAIKAGIRKHPRTTRISHPTFCVCRAADPMGHSPQA